jgi:DNA-binding transcriptional LysR family regulator
VIEPHGPRITFQLSLKIMDRIGDLNLFLRVLDLGSISAAARSLDLSVATASLRLKRLEKTLGARLFHRTTRKLRLTPEGTALVEQGRTLIEGLEALTDSLHSASTEISGTLRASVPASFGRQYISPLVPEFLSQHPRLRLHVDLDDRMRDLAGEGFDVAIRIGTVREPSLVARKLAPNRRVLCASPEYLKKYGTPTRPEQLSDHECLVMLGDRGPANVWTLGKRGGRECAVRVKGRLESNLGEVLRDAAIDGLGIALHSTWHICEDLRAGRLKIVLPDYSPPESGIYAVMLQRKLMPLRSRAFIEFLAERLGNSPPWERHLKRRLK